jgi:hypothetical protein
LFSIRSWLSFDVLSLWKRKRREDWGDVSVLIEVYRDTNSPGTQGTARDSGTINGEASRVSYATPHTFFVETLCR